MLKKSRFDAPHPSDGDTFPARNESKKVVRFSDQVHIKEIPARRRTRNRVPEINKVRHALKHIFASSRKNPRWGKLQQSNLEQCKLSLSRMLHSPDCLDFEEGRAMEETGGILGILSSKAEENMRLDGVLSRSFSASEDPMWSILRDECWADIIAAWSYGVEIISAANGNPLWALNRQLRSWFRAFKVVCRWVDAYVPIIEDDLCHEVDSLLRLEPFLNELYDNSVRASGARWALEGDEAGMQSGLVDANDEAVVLIEKMKRSSMQRVGISQDLRGFANHRQIPKKTIGLLESLNREAMEVAVSE